MTMKTNKWKSQTEIPGRRDSGKVMLLKIDPRKRRKSDLTLTFLNSSDYVRTLARQFSRTDKIDRMRQSAVSNQRANPGSRPGSMIPTKSQLRAIRELADDPTKAHAIDSPSPSPSHCNSRASGSRFPRTMTSGTFKKLYSELAAQTHFKRKILKSNAENTMLGRRGSKSQFYPTPEPQASGNDKLSIGDSWDEGESPVSKLDEIEEDEQDEQDEQVMKSQKSYPISEEVSDTEDQETDSEHRQSDRGQEIKSIDEESEGNEKRD
jgi:hypothetical protein